MKHRKADRQAAPSLMQPEDFGIGQLFERVPDAVIVREAGSARIVLWNPAAAAMFGYGEAEILGHPLSTIIPGGLPADRRALGLVVVPARHKGGQALSIELSSSPIANARVSGDFELTIARDVTARLQAEAALRERAELLDIAHDAIIMLDPDLRITYWNRGAERLYGWPSEEAVGRVVSELLGTRFPVSREDLMDTLGRCDLWEGELTHTRRDGSPLVVASRWVLRRDAAGVPVAILDANNDITRRKRQAEALERANAELREADRYKDEFLGILSHELRTPLNFIISYASVLDEEVAGPLNSQEHAFVAKVLLGADRLLVMVDNLLEMSRLAANKFKLSRAWTDYAALVDQVIEALAPVAAEKRLSLHAEVQVPPELWLDGEHIRRALINLVDNALKFTEPGGRVSLSARLEGDRLVTEVCDTGVGIAELDLPKLFTRFKQLDMSATREAGGMGIGLALSKAIVEGHGGAIRVTSRPGEGSCFRFELPLAQPGAPADHGASPMAG